MATATPSPCPPNEGTSKKRAISTKQEIATATKLSWRFTVRNLIQGGKHGDLYSLIDVLDPKDDSYQATAFKLKGVAPKTRGYRMRTYKRLLSCDSFVCSFEELGLTWVVNSKLTEKRHDNNQVESNEEDEIPAFLQDVNGAPRITNFPIPEGLSNNPTIKDMAEQDFLPEDGTATLICHHQQLSGNSSREPRRPTPGLPCNTLGSFSDQAKGSSSDTIDCSSKKAREKQRWRGKQRDKRSMKALCHASALDAEAAFVFLTEQLTMGENGPGMSYGMDRTDELKGIDNLSRPQNPLEGFFNFKSHEGSIFDHSTLYRPLSTDSFALSADENNSASDSFQIVFETWFRENFVYSSTQAALNLMSRREYLLGPWGLD